MLPGDRAPDFTLRDQDGVERHLAELVAHGPVVVFFYPLAGSPGCTAESCHFRDLASEFADLQATRLGISMDPVARQAAFARAQHLDYPLLSDPGGVVARAYGVRRALGLLRVRRVTFVIGSDRIVVARFASERHMGAHADHALAALRALGEAPSR